MDQTVVNIVCMKWGTLYGPAYVNRLYGMVQRNLQRPFNFYCISDDFTGIRPEVQLRRIPPFEPPPNGTWSVEKIADVSTGALRYKG